MNRHQRTEYYVVNEGVYSDRRVPACAAPTTREEIRHFRFSRLLARNRSATEEDFPGVSAELARKLAVEMTRQNDADVDDQPDGVIPAGYTYLGQFVDHDLTSDRTRISLGTKVSVEDLLQGRSPALDLDSLYGLGPAHDDSARFYENDGVRLLMGRTAAASGLPDLQGFDLPRLPFATAAPGTALIPDHRNDENLAVAQIHLAFIRFHNKVVGDLRGRGTPGITLFETARETVVKHYQWMLRHDYLPRIVDPAIVDDVFTYGRRFFEVPGPEGWVTSGDMPTMPVEFSVAAFRLGHSMVRGAYEWNGVFNSDSPEVNPRHLASATLPLLFRFSGTSGALTENDPLPSNWIADFRRFFQLTSVPGADPALAPPATGLNFAKRIDTLLVDPLRTLPPGSFGAGPGQVVPEIELNLAFRNLVRANMIDLAGGQQAAEHLRTPALSEKDILHGNGTAAVFGGLPPAEQEVLVANTPLWLYVLREAELNEGRLTGAGGRIVAEVFHRAMEGSRYSIVREPSWKPALGPQPGTFGMPHLLLYAFEGRSDLLNPVG
jgi:hypothetical protein